MSEWTKGFLSGLGSALIGTILALVWNTPSHASERVDWVQRSLDKTIIVEHNRTYTVPAPQGSGTTVVTKGRTVPQITRDARIMNGGIVKYDFQLVPRNVRNNHSSRGADPIVRPNLP